MGNSISRPQSSRVEGNASYMADRTKSLSRNQHIGNAVRFSDENIKLLDTTKYCIPTLVAIKNDYESEDPPTSWNLVSDGSHHQGENANLERLVMGKDLTRDSSWFDVTSYCEASSKPGELGSDDTDMEVRKNVTNPNQDGFQPSSHIIHEQAQGEPRYIWHRCGTKPSSISSVYAHVQCPNHIYRWKPGSSITFNVDLESFANSTEAAYAAASLEKATSEWNKGDIGVRFERTADNMPSVFRLTYSECQTIQLATSFFPGDPPDQRLLRIHSQCFDERHHDHMVNVFCYELGHVLGLRHEFAMTCPGELTHPSRLVGNLNPFSVMNYFNDLGMMRIQETDYNGVRQLYQPERRELGGCTIVDVEPRDMKPGGVSNSKNLDGHVILRARDIEPRNTTPSMVFLRFWLIWSWLASLSYSGFFPS
ncbi:hypothetical protein F5Y04DRAFT_248225 [Hypomontagnella monticulosa]|nr:hypothetical protein F5Y04DRAFT_248225 [Hypomontagnella monticulosa]